MKPASLNFPEDNDELAGWLAGHVLSRHLAELVAELAAIRGDESPTYSSLKDILGSERQAVLTQGLQVLPHSRLAELLRTPALLLDLQDTVLAEGGACWDLPETVDDELKHRREAGWMQLRHGIDKEQWQTFSRNVAIDPPPPTRRSAMRPISIGIVLLLLVAAVGAAWHFQVGPFAEEIDSEAWGWSRSGSSTQNSTGRGYLNQLATEADEWSKKRPLTRARLSTRMLQFRQGCAELLFRKHEQLSEADREWLLSECRQWAKALDEELARLEGGDDVIEIREAVDKIAKEIVETLRARAATAGS